MRVFRTFIKQEFGFPVKLIVNKCLLLFLTLRPASSKKGLPSFPADECNFTQADLAVPSQSGWYSSSAPFGNVPNVIATPAGN